MYTKLCLRLLIVSFIINSVLSQVDHYETLNVPRTATKSQIREAYYNLAQKWHPDKNPSKEAEEKYQQISEAYQTLSDPKKRNEYELSVQAGFRSSFTQSSSKSTDINSKNWDWYTKTGHYGKYWLILVCGSNYPQCSPIYDEWERLFPLLDGYIRLGRVDVQTDWRITHNLGIRYVPTILLISPSDGDINFYRGPITASALAQYCQGLIPDVFKKIKTKSDWESIFDWRSTLSRNIDAPEKVKVVLYSVDDMVPIKWKYWSNQYRESIEWYHIHPAFSSKLLLDMIGKTYNVYHPGVAMLFPDPRDSSDIIILKDPDINGRSIELSGNDISNWLESNHIPTLSKVDSDNFLDVVSADSLSLLVAVDFKSSDFAAKILKNIKSTAEQISTLWEQRRGTLTKDIKFSFFGNHNERFQSSFRNSKFEPGSVILVNRATYEFYIIPLNYEKDFSSVKFIPELVDTLLKLTQRKLAVQKMSSVPQSTDSEISLMDAFLSTGTFGWMAAGLGLVLVVGATLVNKSTTTKPKPKTKAEKTPKNKQTEDKEGEKSTNTNATDYTPSLASWFELTETNSPVIFGKRLFTLIFLVDLSKKTQMSSWENVVRQLSHDLETDPILFSWVARSRSTSIWNRWNRLAEESCEDSHSFQPIAIMYHHKRQRYVIYSVPRPKASHDILEISQLQMAYWIQRVLEGQISWKDLDSAMT